MLNPAEDNLSEDSDAWGDWLGDCHLWQNLQRLSKSRQVLQTPMMRSRKRAMTVAAKKRAMTVSVIYDADDDMIMMIGLPYSMIVCSLVQLSAMEWMSSPPS